MLKTTMLSALSPLDGRYAADTAALRAFFSEEALIRARLFIEISSFIALAREPAVRELKKLSKPQERAVFSIVKNFSSRDAEIVKKKEMITKHDVKAAEYFLRERIAKIPGLRSSVEFIHFGLTSEDVNNLAYGILIHEALKDVLVPALEAFSQDLRSCAATWKNIPMLSLTHGQPATPTTVGKEFLVFQTRLDRQLRQLRQFRMQGKLGGAVGNFAAHRAAYPDVDWSAFRKRLVTSLGLEPLSVTTQINPHDDLAELSHYFHRIDTILIGLARDLWMYVSRGIFRQKIIAGEIGSSTMPHKINPINFENAEGNLGLANALFAHFAEKLPISRLQRDLSDSTVQRSIGSAFGYHLLAVRNLRKGLSRIVLDRDVLSRELAEHPEVAAEAIQTVLRKHGVSGAYEKLKTLTRGEAVTREQLREFIRGLKISPADKTRLTGLL